MPWGKTRASHLRLYQSWPRVSFTSLAATQLLLQIHSFQFQLIQLLLNVTHLVLDFLFREVVWVQLQNQM